MNKKIFLLILSLLLTLIIFCSINVVEAEDINELQNKKSELQSQITESNEQVSKIQIDITKNLEQLNNLNEKIYEKEIEITELDKKLESIKQEIKSATDKLNLIEENYNLQKDILKNRIIASYESGDVVYLDLLLRSNTLPEFISNYYLIGEIVKYDDKLLENIENQKVHIENIKQSLEEKQENVKIIKKNKEKTTIVLENSKIIKNSYINKLTEEEKETQKKIDEFQAELNNIEAQIMVLTAGSIGTDYVGGEFAWPAPGFTIITSKFGMRLHPIFKINRMHSGVDIGMPMGAYIVAANDGIVIKATYASGYGNMVMINHGGGVATVYGHGSKIIAQTGQTVKRGDIIMKAGSTGWSTGPHLHFEVRINGKCVDPLPFITRKINSGDENNIQKMGDKNNNENNE